MKEFTITIEKATEMEEFIKINATRTIIESNGNVRCAMEQLSECYYFIYENETLVKIIKRDYDGLEEHFVAEYTVEQPKEITIYGTKIAYTKKDIDLVNKFINDCNAYVKDICGIDTPTHTHSIMVSRGLCDFNFDDTIINCKYGYSLLDKDGETNK